MRGGGGDGGALFATRNTRTEREGRRRRETLIKELKKIELELTKPLRRYIALEFT